MSVPVTAHHPVPDPEHERIVISGQTLGSTIAPSSLAAPSISGSQQDVIEGVIDSIPAPNVITIAGRRIQVNQQTAIRRGNIGLIFADLHVGLRSRVSGRSEDALFRATLIEVQDQVGSPTRLAGPPLRFRTLPPSG